MIYKLANRLLTGNSCGFLRIFLFRVWCEEGLSIGNVVDLT